MSENITSAEKNDILIRSRGHIDVTGVRDVLSFDDRAVVMITSGGEMTVEGAELKIGVLDTDKGIVSIDGKICAVIYYDSAPSEKKKLFGRAFK